MATDAGRVAMSGVAVCALAGAAHANFPINTLVIEGDSVDGVGLVTSIFGLAVNSNGEWLVEADTDNPDTAADSVLLKNGLLLLREGQPIDPPGAGLGGFDSLQLSNNGDEAYNHSLDNQPSNMNSAVYFKNNLRILESDISTVLPDPTPYLGFFDVKLNDANRMAVVASVDIPGVGTTVDRALVFLENADLGTTEVLFAAEGDEIIPGRFVTDFGTGPHESSLNDLGDYMYAVDVDGDTTTNDLIMLNNTLIAQEGSASPVAGRTWATLTSTELDVNNAGDYVYTGSLDGDTASNLLIVKNDQKFRQEGDSITTDTGTWQFTSFGSGPVDLDDNGNVLWYGDWNDSNTDVDTGLFLNDKLLVQEGVTTIDGLLVDTLAGVSDGYFISDDGSFIIFEATLEGGLNGAFLIKVPSPGVLSVAGIGALGLLRRRR